MMTSDEKFYAQRDANFKKRVYDIFFDDPTGHSEEEVLNAITKLKEMTEFVPVEEPSHKHVRKDMDLL